MISENAKALVLLAIPTLIVGLAIITVQQQQSGAQPAVPECVTDEDRVHIRATSLAAVDEGLKDHVKVLFAGWIKDPSRQPERASAGIQAAIVAYQRARADVLRWNPTSC